MKTAILTVMTQLKRIKIDLQHTDHQLDNNQMIISV